MNKTGMVKGAKILISKFEKQRYQTNYSGSIKRKK